MQPTPVVIVIDMPIFFESIFWLRSTPFQGRSKPTSLPQLILLPDASFDGRPLCNPVNPLQQMRKLLHILHGQTRIRPPLDPRPCPDIRDTVLALAFAGKVVPRLTRVLTAQANLQHSIDTQSLVSIPLDGVGNLLLCKLVEVVELALVRRAGAVPEEEPLQAFGVLEVILKAEFTLRIILLQQV